jgi:hypothetical protein
MAFPVLHFEVLAQDAPAMQRFYRDAFGWRIGPPASDCATVFPDSSKEQTMSATLLFRIASIVFLLFALGHTFGFLSFKPPTAEGLAVQKAMNAYEGGARFVELEI